MKNILKTSLICIFLLCSGAVLSAQEAQNMSAKERRQARKEARQMEKAIRDSLKLEGYFDEEINVGYGTVKRRHLTTSVSKVSPEENQMGSYSNMGEYLMGRVPGLTVYQDGDSYKYVIRGVSTLYGSSDPLFLVDGVETDNIDHINPRDVRSVEVLKDGSASIYGTRGANGVILITTKR